MKLRILLLFFALFSMPVITSDSNSMHTSTNYVNGEVIVSLKESLSIKDLLVTNETASFAEYMAVLNISNIAFQVKDKIDNVYLLSYDGNFSVPFIINCLLESPYIYTAQPNYIVTAYDLTDDEYSSSQWSLNNTGSYESYYGSLSYKDILPSENGIDIEAGKAWDIYPSIVSVPQEVIVAVIDTGIDYNHPDLQENLWINPHEIPNDGIDNDKNGYVDDIYGWDFYNNDNTTCHYSYDKNGNATASLKDSDDHGTHCAGIIAASSNNKIGIAGIASNSNIKIMTLKALGGGTNNSPGGGNTYDIIKAIKYATNMGAKVCNMSWGHSNYNPIMQQTLRQVMKESDMLFVAAAGNNSDNNDKLPLYPASYTLDHVISVASVNANGILSDYSNYGEFTVDLAAPGEDILSTVIGSYRSFSGTSMAAPHVTGIAALLYSITGNVYASNIKDIMTTNLTPLQSLDTYLIHPGIASAYKAIQSYDSIETDTITPDLTLTASYHKADHIVSLRPSDKGGSGIRTIKYLKGIKKAGAFKRGTEGISVYNNKISLSKAGSYTFYISDYAGNELISVVDIAKDITPPALQSNYKVSNNYKTITVNFTAADTQSGVKTVKFAKGKRTPDYFKKASNGTKINISKGSGSFQVKSPGKYSIYLVDYAGNKTVKTMNVVPIKAVKIKLDVKKITLNIGETYTLTSAVTPADSTDKITYHISDPSVVSVSLKGKITAKENGKSVITAVTSSGKKYNCTVTVK